MKRWAVIASVAAALTFVGAAGAVVVDQDVAQGNTPSFTLSATRTTTAFSVGAWTFSPALVTVDWVTNCLFAQNDRSGRVFLVSGQSARVFIASRAVGTPWLGWDFCSIAASYSVDFGENPDGSQIDSAVAGWLVSDE